MLVVLCIYFACFCIFFNVQDFTGILRQPVGFTGFFVALWQTSNLRVAYTAWYLMSGYFVFTFVYIFYKGLIIISIFSS